MEFCQNVLGRTAAHQELEREAMEPLMIRLSCALKGGAKAKVIAERGGWYQRVVGAEESVEDFNCSYGMAAAFEPVFAGSAVEFVARDEVGEVRAFRLCGHRFFAGTLFQPERMGLRGKVHPLVRAFLESADGLGSL